MLLRYWVAIAVTFSEQLCSKHPRGGLKFVFKNTRTTDFDKLSSTIDFLPIGGEVSNYGRSRWIPSGAPFTSTYDRSTYHRTFICTTPGIAIVNILLGAAVVVGKQSRRHPFPPCRLIQWHHDEIIHRVQFVYKVDVMVIYSDLVSRDVTWLECGVHLAEYVTIYVRVFHVYFVSNLANAKVVGELPYTQTLAPPNDQRFFSDHVVTGLGRNVIDAPMGAYSNVVVCRIPWTLCNSPRYYWVHAIFVTHSTSSIIIAAWSELHVKVGVSTRTLFNVYYPRLTMGPVTQSKDDLTTRQIAAHDDPCHFTFHEMSMQEFTPEVIVINAIPDFATGCARCLQLVLPRLKSRSNKEPVAVSKSSKSPTPVVAENVKSPSVLSSCQKVLHIPTMFLVPNFSVSPGALVRPVDSGNIQPASQVLKDTAQKFPNSEIFIHKNDKGSAAKVEDQIIAIPEFVNLVVRISSAGDDGEKNVAKTMCIQVPITSIAEPILIDVDVDNTGEGPSKNEVLAMSGQRENSKEDNIFVSNSTPKPFLVSHVPGINDALRNLCVHTSPTIKVAGARRRAKIRNGKKKAVPSESTSESPVKNKGPMMIESTTPADTPPVVHHKLRSEFKQRPAVIPHSLNERCPSMNSEPGARYSMTKPPGLKKLVVQQTGTTRSARTLISTSTKNTDVGTLKDVSNKTNLVISPTDNRTRSAIKSVKTCLAKEIHRAAKPTRIPLPLRQIDPTKSVNIFSSSSGKTSENSTPMTSLLNDPSKSAAKASSGSSTGSKTLRHLRSSVKSKSTCSACKSFYGVSESGMKSQSYTSNKQHVHDKQNGSSRSGQAKRLRRPGADFG